jgi:hypothetical protein
MSGVKGGWAWGRLDRIFSRRRESARGGKKIQVLLVNRSGHVGIYVQKYILTLRYLTRTILLYDCTAS